MNEDFKKVKDMLDDIVRISGEDRGDVFADILFSMIFYKWGSNNVVPRNKAEIQACINGIASTYKVHPPMILNDDEEIPF